ncbi:uncharacterized protein LOC106362200 isoform X1 [Brassica napus]|uniref:uncharacterized protein LOC106362200 isoform X1 n=1 Tax=Brassica napus TaxID=3708 RepID=UPI0006AAD8A6|nr:uncharacterized protein LOC106362200 isoform X1 [Brassica napus]
MNVVAGRMRNTTLGTNELILCSVVKSLFLLNMSAFKTMGTSEEKPASSTQDIPPHTVSRLVKLYAGLLWRRRYSESVFPIKGSGYLCGCQACDYTKPNTSQRFFLLELH